MADLFKLRVIAPDRNFYEGEVMMVEFTGTEGAMGIYKNHVPLTVILAPGILRIHEVNGVKRAALHAGFVEILPEQVTILAEVVEWPQEIDRKRAEEAKIRAERRLSGQSQETDTARAELALRRSLTRLGVTK
ncbi:MAG: ATP synthase F1 subunit epsilon [bacterium]|nr:ATP synthase F1 subunit epsilon [bacterium]